MSCRGCCSVDEPLPRMCMDLNITLSTKKKKCFLTSSISFTLQIKKLNQGRELSEDRLKKPCFKPTKYVSEVGLPSSSMLPAMI
ncbi:hypothetical protein I79_002610 [Cricetulus griseus]|uniref:Uncharacterized protein n=1 Tax=Cricetulus griseus TaxID=10029 RepID=G3GXW6_CRIGR|nr:hypothetical protein I79_002610 [Cricetulus griseus]